MKKTTLFIVSLIGILLTACSIPLYLALQSPEAGATTLTKFSSYDELNNLIENAPQTSKYIFGYSNFRSSFGVQNADGLTVPEATTSDFSETNVQVGGVDEADIIKTDGEYIYVVSGGNITLVKAYPSTEAGVVSKICLNGEVMGIFVNGDRLVVFETEFVNQGWLTKGEENLEITMRYQPPKTSIKVYDISDKSSPVLKKEFSVDGYYFSARMIENYVYAIVNHNTFMNYTKVLLPTICENNSTRQIQATDIYYYNSTDSYYSFTTIVALSIQDDQQQPTTETVLLGSSSTIYVSQDNIYLAIPEYPMEQNQNEKTLINRIKIHQESLTIQAAGEVPGRVHDQFSMDEHNGYFRIATTVGHVARSFDEADSVNNVYVLDMNLNIVGKVENLAPKEKIYSVRFMDEICYVVTFKKVDPLFVIDLQTPTNPKVLGQLKVTGYSDYLHPYDENHLIGIGKETVEAQEDDFAWYQGVKISLFDVSDSLNPTELTKYEIGDRGTYSPVLDDHKALLFDRSRNLLVIPVLVAEIDQMKYDDQIPDNARGDYVWQGAYVFDISVDGLELKGKITHMENGEAPTGIYFGTEHYVQRAIYIEDVLYTISNKKIMMNSLETLAELNTVELS
ncbi:MAG: beta-propeller domain-containing protein [Candidatus Bathyarchaeota archaeon]|nr:beta-propeller domain-containing protein [Candidatus Bathyarchaeota archaeon]